MCLSDPQIAVARTRSRTSAWPGRGTGTDFTSVAPGPAAARVLTTAVIDDGTRETDGAGRGGAVLRRPSRDLRLPANGVSPRPGRLGRSRSADPRRLPPRRLQPVGSLPARRPAFLRLR